MSQQTGSGALPVPVVVLELPVTPPPLVVLLLELVGSGVAVLVVDVVAVDVVDVVALLELPSLVVGGLGPTHAVARARAGAR